MPARVPQIIKEEVFQSWLGGSFRRQTAAKCGVSEGSVSNILAEKKLEFGSDQLNSLRDLSIAMSRSGLSVQQCADGHRVAMTMRNMGVDEEHFGEFIEKLSSLRIDAGLSPQNLANQIDELCYFREENQSPNGVISIPQIFQTLNTLKAEVSKNLQTIASMESKKSDLESAISSIQHQKAAVEAD